MAAGRTRAPSGASLQIQSFVDIAGRQEPVGDYDRRAFDVDTQYHTALGAHQDLVAGAGYRFIDERFAGRVGFSLTPAEDSSSLLTAFVQDEIALFGNRLAVTLGSQVQYDSDSGAGVQPTARVMWKALPRQRLWAATSRALRTPSLYERGIRVDFPPVPSASGLPLVVTVLGNPAAETETLVDAEAGYRLEIGTAASIDVTGFVGRYDHLRTQEPAAPVVQFVPSPHILVTSQFGNQLEATTRGLEVAGHWTPVPAWRLDGSYTAFHVTPHLAAASQDPSAAAGGRERAAHAVAAAVGVLAGQLARRSTSRSSMSVRSSSSRWTPTREPTSARNGGSPAVCPPWRSARTSSTRRTPSSPAPARCCWRRKSRAAPACGCAGRPARDQPVGIPVRDR